MKNSKLITWLMAVNLTLMTISVSIAAVILCRPFYYLHIPLYGLEKYSGFTADQIKTGYNEMLNFCLGLSDEFSTGVMKFSAEGKAHFEDCRVLFRLDFIVAIISILVLIAYIILKRKEKISAARITTRGFMYFSGWLTLLGFFSLGLFAAMDFSSFFVTFHHVLFPGKENWIFSPFLDEIILVLPEEYFANCGAFIVLLIIILSIFFIIRDRKTKL
ncbi:MAG: TIGR01906 family membrane protein, partial [Erysipelotrichaceae bacterium]|nr:TIGR01906 family membrane protein [Erysipelotrichaceae bacterium]